MFWTGAYTGEGDFFPFGFHQFIFDGATGALVAAAHGGDRATPPCRLASFWAIAESRSDMQGAPGFSGFTTTNPATEICWHCGYRGEKCAPMADAFAPD